MRAAGGVSERIFWSFLVIRRTVGRTGQRHGENDEASQVPTTGVGRYHIAHLQSENCMTALCNTSVTHQSHQSICVADRLQCFWVVSLFYLVLSAALLFYVFLSLSSEVESKFEQHDSFVLNVVSVVAGYFCHTGSDRSSRSETGSGMFRVLFDNSSSKFSACAVEQRNGQDPRLRDICSVRLQGHGILALSLRCRSHGSIRTLACCAPADLRLCCQPSDT